MDLTGLRVGLIGTGSSGVQVCRNWRSRRCRSRSSSGPRSSSRRPGRGSSTRPWSPCGRPTTRRSGAGPGSPRAASRSPPRSPPRRNCRRRAARRMRGGWRRGGIWFLDGTFSDAVTSRRLTRSWPTSSASRSGARARPGGGGEAQAQHARRGTKRVPIGSDYYEAYNRPNVSLVDLRADPIERITGGRDQNPLGPAPARRDRVRHRLRRADRVDHPAERRRPGRRAAGRRVGAGLRTYLALMVPRLPEPVHDHRALANRQFNQTAPVAIRAHPIVGWAAAYCPCRPEIAGRRFDLYDVGAIVREDYRGARDRR